LISSGGYEFGTKEIIAEKITDFISVSNRKSRATEASTAQGSLAMSQHENHPLENMGFKKRTLSIASIQDDRK
jgi:hypothetical protein